MCADVSPAHEIFSHGYHQVWFEGAEVPTIDRIPAALLGAVAEARDALDMDRMAQCAVAPLHSTQATNAAPARTGGARHACAASPHVRAGSSAASAGSISSRSRTAPPRCWSIRSSASACTSRRSRRPTPTRAARASAAAYCDLGRSNLGLADDRTAGHPRTRLPRSSAQLDPVPELERLGALPRAEWQRLIDTYVLHTPCAAVVGVPSAAKAKALAAETEELTRAQVRVRGVRMRRPCPALRKSRPPAPRPRPPAPQPPRPLAHSAPSADARGAPHGRRGDRRSG